VDTRERVRRTLAGEQVDRPPLCLWHHFRPEGSPAALAAATVDFFGGLDLDLFKVMPDLPYPTPPVGTLRTAEQWLTLPILNARPGGPLGGMREAVATVRALRPDAVVVATVFSPLALALRFSEGAGGLMRAAQQDIGAVRRGLGVLANNVAGMCEECLGAGADGIFFATAGAGDGLLSEEAYRVLGRPFDLRVLEACTAGWCNILHLHATSDLRWQWMADYPVPVYSWSDRRTGVPLRDVVQALPDKTVMGGIDEVGAVVAGDMAALTAEIQDAVRQTGGRRLILAGGCSVPDDIKAAHLRGARMLASQLVCE